MGCIRISSLAARVAGFATGVWMLVGLGPRLLADCGLPGSETVILSLESIDIEGSTSASVSDEVRTASLRAEWPRGSLWVEYFRETDRSSVIERYADSTSIEYVASISCGGE